MVAWLSPPADLLELLGRPGASWTREEGARVMEWLQEARQFRFLVARIRRSAPRHITREDAEDLLMAFVERELRGRPFLDYDPSLGPFPPPHGFTKYLLRRIQLFVLDEVRRNARVLARDRRIEEAPEPVDGSESPHQGVERSEALQRARHAWTLIEGVLSRDDLNVFTERLLGEKSFDEIALELQATVPHVRMRYYLAVRRVRKLLRDRSATAFWQPWLSLLRTRGGRRPPPGSHGDYIGCTVFGPQSVGRRDRCLIQVYVHALEHAVEALRTAREFDDTAARLGAKTLDLMVVDGTRLTFTLSLPGIIIDEPVQSLTWNGRTDSVSFGLEIPADSSLGTHIGTVVVLVNSVPAGSIRFKLVVRARRQHDGELLRLIDSETRHFTMAFISYASEDRNKVLARVQMLRLLGIKYFQDVLELEPGQRWEKELYRHIDECDLFLLFWSAAASASQWVLKEVDYAVRRKGGDEDAPPAIQPVIIDGPPVVPPPPGLEHLHFNDRLLYFMTPEGPSS